MMSHRSRRSAFRRIALMLVLLAFGVFARLALAADLPSSGLEWSEAVQPGRYFDATGRRAAVFGRQNGRLEAWIYPIQVLHGMRLELRLADMAEPVPGEALLERIVVRPESTTLVYVHARFTLRQIIWVPRDEPAIVTWFEVDATQPLLISVKFVPDFKPMWPASLGGQFSYWSDADKAFCLSDATGRPTAMIGSPATDSYTQHMDHALVGGEMLLRIKADPGASDPLVPLVMSMSLESAQKAAETYRGVLARARDLYAERVARWRDFLARTLQIETPEPALNRACDWAKVAIESGWVCNDKYGCGLIAGYGPAGESERPGFAWWFGGDALMASWAMTDYGDTAGAIDVLRFLRARQRKDGKIMHEMTQSVDLVDWFGRFGFAYMHADTTPMYLYSLGRLWRQGGTDGLAEFRESARRAYDYCVSTLDPRDGLMDNTKAGLAAVEVGPLRGKVVKDIYLEGFWVAGLAAMRDLAGAWGDATLQADAESRLRRAADSLNKEWWSPSDACYTFGLTADGKRADRVGNWSAVLLGLAGDQVPAERRAAAAGVFARPELATDWGVRWLSDRDALYDPTSYNNGTVWPFMSGICALAQFENDQPQAGYATLLSIARLTGTQSPGAMPEHMVGDRHRAGERSVPHQLFGSVGVAVPTVCGLLGLAVRPVDAGPTTRAADGSASTRPAALGNEWRISPRLPPQWERVRFKGYVIGASRASCEIRQGVGRVELSIEFDGPPVAIAFEPLLPLGATIKRAVVNGQAVTVPADARPGSPSAALRVAPSERRVEIVVEHAGGVAIVPPVSSSQVGDTSSAVKWLDWRERSQAEPWSGELTIAGRSGRTERFTVLTQRRSLRAENAALVPMRGGYALEVRFDGKAGEYATKTVVLIAD